MNNEELAQELQKQFDDKKFELLLTENRLLISRLTSPYKRLLSEDELQQAARLGIWQAIAKYDPERGSFFTFAEYFIKSNCNYEVLNSGYSVKIPPPLYWQSQNYRRFISDFETEKGRTPSREEIRRALKISEEKLTILELCDLIRNKASLSAPIGEDALELEDMIADPLDPYEETERQIDFEIMQRELWEAVNRLPGKLPDVIRARYQRGETMADIMNALNLSKGQVERYTRKACRELYRRTPNCKSYFEVYLPTKTFPHVGVNDFQRTHYSEVERAAFYEMGIDWKSEDEPNTEK